MNTTSAYKELNLPEGASEMEIRAAFRRMAKDNHPDVSRLGDVEAFRRACSAYRELMRLLAKDRKIDARRLPVSTPFVFDGQRNAGLDVYFDIAMVKPAYGESFNLVLPVAASEACPRCLGQGRTLGRISSESSVYRPQSCPKCGGAGSVNHHRNLSVTVTPEMARRGKFRLRQAGGYLPKEARRGDLVVTIRWVDRLPAGH